MVKVGNKIRFLIKFLAQTKCKLAQVNLRLWLGQCIFNCSNHVQKSNPIMFSVADLYILEGGFHLKHLADSCMLILT